MRTPSETDRKKALAEIETQGFTILEDVIDASLLDALLASLSDIEEKLDIRPASNDFEGRQTLRVYNLLAHGDPWTQLPIHPELLPIVERVLDPGCLLSTLSSISIGQDETPQLIHSDDQVIALPRPHPAVVCNSMWALTDFTEANGATRVVPGSHRFDHYPDPTRSYDSIPAEMARGSILVWDGGLWHGGGANTTPDRRIGIANNYCAGFIRQQENQQLGIPQSLAATFPERLQRLIGYGVYRGLIGHIDKRDPLDLLGGDGALRIVWDD